MVEHDSGVVPQADSSRTDSVLKAVTLVLVAAILGLGLLFGYTVWQSRAEEKTSTPAQRALGSLGDLVRKNPNSAPARVRYAEALAQAGSYSQAVEQLRIAVKLSPKHTGAWLDLGLIAMQTEDTKSAEGYFKKVVDLTEGADYENMNSRREQALFHLGEIALDAKRYEDAAGYFKASIRIRKDASDSYFLLAEALHGMGSDDSAIEQLNAALTFDPNYAQAHYLYGTILASRGDKINAAVHLSKAVELAPARKEPKEALSALGNVSDLLKSGRAALADKKFAVALDDALLARAIEPKNVDAALLHAETLIAKGDSKGAAKVIDEAKAFAADDSRVASLAKQLQSK